MRHGVNHRPFIGLERHVTDWVRRGLSCSVRSSGGAAIGMQGVVLMFTLRRESSCRNRATTYTVSPWPRLGCACFRHLVASPLPDRCVGVAFGSVGILADLSWLTKLMSGPDGLKTALSVPHTTLIFALRVNNSVLDRSDQRIDSAGRPPLGRPSALE